MSSTQINKVTLVMGGVVLALVSAAGGVAASLFYFSKPLDKWQGQFSQTYLPQQVAALKALKEGAPEKAIDYLQMATGFTLMAMGQQRAQGESMNLTPEAKRAVDTFCNDLARPNGAVESRSLNLAEACVLMQQP